MKKLAVLAALALWGQNTSDVRFDTEQARVVVITEQPHHPGAMHEHKANLVGICLGAGQMKLASPAGKVEKIDCKSGDVWWSPAGVRHTSENTSDQPFQVVEIELKNKPQAVTMP